ncbi:MAG: META domain-containing protein [Methylibium sp.]|uniref:META domain-containing protein n=1 Tax=Methylibium sp. TaxID=2067992 RepID=UPI0017935075|nr:META domain-containing protein [Methylibium sp.]MBA3597864.1 META domain-containing protein [Methylibium sp.]
MPSLRPSPMLAGLPRRTALPAARRAACRAALAASVGLAGCATSSQPPAPPAVYAPPVSAQTPTPTPPAHTAATAAPDPQVLGLWKIEQARAAPIVHKLNARLNFDGKGRLTGSGGCNSIAGSYALAGNRLELGPLVTTRKHCGEVLMEQEDRVLTALERAVGARVPPHGLLELSDENGTVLLRATRVEATGQ